MLPTIAPTATSGKLTITGPAGGITLDGNHTTSMIYFDVNTELTLNNLSFINGYANNYGGAIKSIGTLTINGCTFTGNGTAPYNNGGALYAAGTTVINNSTFTKNYAGGNGPGAGGGAGGAIFFATYSSTPYYVNNCTIVDNSSSSFGGGVYTEGPYIYLNNSILIDNHGWVWLDHNGNIVADHSIVASSPGGVTGSNNIFDVDPMAGSLASNGGPTQTMALLTGSPAIDGGVPLYSGPLTTDQRGAGYGRLKGARIDIGAYELQVVDSTAPAVTVTTPTVNQIMPASAWTSGFVNGTATDDYGVSGVTVKLFKTVGGVKQFWNGTAFTSPAAPLAATLVAPTQKTTNWSLTNVPTTTQLGLGTFSVVVSAYDSAGNVSAAVTRNFTVTDDFTAPVVTVNHPVVAAVLTPTQFQNSTVDGTATDNVAVTFLTGKLSRTIGSTKEYWNGSTFVTDSVNTELNSTALNAASVTWSVKYQPAAAQLVDGSYALTVQAKDAIGNVTTVTRPFTIRSDSEKPVVTVNTPKANQHLQATDVNAATITGKATDNLGVSDVSVKLYRTAGSAKEFWNGSTFTSASVSVAANLTGSDATNLNWNLASLPTADQFSPGTYNLQVGATDVSGNSATLVTRTFIIDPVHSSSLRFNASAKSF